MTTIDPATQAALALQTQVTAWKERVRAKGAASAHAREANRGALSGTFAQRLQAIAPDDPQRARKAVRLFLQGELVREFGDALLNDPQLPTLLDAVQEQMAQDTQINSAVDALGAWLLSGNASRPG